MSVTSTEGGYPQPAPTGRPLRWKHSDPSSAELRSEQVMPVGSQFTTQHPYRHQDNVHATQRNSILPSSVIAAYASHPPPQSRPAVMGTRMEEGRNPESHQQSPAGQTHFSYDLRALEGGSRGQPPSTPSDPQQQRYRPQLLPPPHSQNPQRHYQQPRSDAEPRRSSSQSQIPSTSTSQAVTTIHIPSAEPSAKASSPTNATSNTSLPPSVTSHHPPPAPSVAAPPQPPPPPDSSPTQQQAQGQPGGIHPIVAKNAAKALAPIRHLYEQAWSQTVTNVQQEMSRMHTELLSILETEHKQLVGTREAYGRLKQDHEVALAELERVRAKNVELKGRDEEAKTALATTQKEAAGLRAEVERYALICQRLRAENQVLDASLREAHSQTSISHRPQQMKAESVEKDRLSPVEGSDSRRATKEYMDDRLERLKQDFAKQLEAQMAVVLKEVQDQKAAREDAEKLLKEMRESSVSAKPELNRHYSETVTLVGTPVMEELPSSPKRPKEEVEDFDPRLDFPIKYTLSPTTMNHPHGMHASDPSGSVNNPVSRTPSPQDHHPRVERTSTPMRTTHAPIAEHSPLPHRASPLPTPRPSPLLPTQITSTTSGSGSSSKWIGRSETDVIEPPTSIQQTNSGTSSHKPPLAISIPRERLDSLRSRPPSPRPQPSGSPSPGNARPVEPSRSPSPRTRASSAQSASPQLHPQVQPQPQPQSRPSSSSHTRTSSNASNGIASAAPSASTSNGHPSWSQSPRVPPLPSRLPDERSYSAPGPCVVKEQQQTTSVVSSASVPPMASLTPDGNQRSTISHPWYSSSSSSTNNIGRDVKDSAGPQPPPLPPAVPARGLKRDRTEYERVDDHAKSTPVPATALTARPLFTQWKVPASPHLPASSLSTTTDHHQDNSGERPRAKIKTEEGSRDAKPVVRNPTADGSPPASAGSGSGSTGGGIGSAGGVLRWKSSSQSSVGGAPPAAAPTPSKNKIGINHMELLYETKGDRMCCRMCRTPTLKDQPQPKTPATFPTKATWAELIGHCQKTHPKSFEDLEKLSPPQIAELRQRMTSSKISGFILG